jgi:hypothetical protein
MTIEFPCQNCLQPLRVPDTSAGKAARCPRCKAVTPVPAGGWERTADRGQKTEDRVREPAPQAYPSVHHSAPTQPTAPTSSAGPAAPSSNDALFAMLKAATTPQPPPGAAPFAPQPGMLPPASSASGQFAPAAPLPGAATINPYASPAEAFAPQLGYSPAGERPGLPWEVEGPGVVSWWKTAQMCLSDATQAFRLMRREGGLGSPLMFAVCGMMIGFAGQMLWQLPFLLIEAFGKGNAGGQQFALTEAMIEIGGGAVITILFATFGLFLSAAIYHVALLMLGGASQSFETTYRVVAFTHGSLAWLQVIPVVGGCIILVMHFVCLINGLAQAQETTTGKAAAAVFLPLLLCIAAVVGLAVVIGVIIAANA